MFEEHLRHPAGRGREVPGGADGAAGGAACGDLIRITLRVDGDRVAAAGFEASGCGSMVAAGSAAVTRVEGERVLEAARVSARDISDELGGLSAGKFHAADLAADALHRALGAAARAGAAIAADERLFRQFESFVRTGRLPAAAIDSEVRSLRAKSRRLDLRLAGLGMDDCR